MSRLGRGSVCEVCTLRLLGGLQSHLAIQDLMHGMEPRIKRREVPHALKCSGSLELVSPGYSIQQNCVCPSRL